MEKNIASLKKINLTLVLLCFGYFLIELIINQHYLIDADEFWFAHRIYQFKDGIPYLDFAPYKTVLGYYLLLPTMLLSSHVFATLIIMKNTLAAINAIVLAIACNWLTKYFSAKAIILSLLLLICTDTMLTYSTSIRVDLLAYWFGLFSILSILDEKYSTAGILAGLGFVTSQKVIWYLFSLNLSLLIMWVIFHQSRRGIRNIIMFNLMAGLIFASYIAFWSWVSSWHTVYESIFKEAAVMYNLAVYSQYRRDYWAYISYLNPLLFSLWAFSPFSLAVKTENDATYQKRFLITCTGLTTLACLFLYKQPFPYYMQVTYPIFLLLYSAFFHWVYLITRDKQPVKLIVPISILRTYTSIYLLLAYFWVYASNLPLIYYFIYLLPTFTLLLIESRHKQPASDNKNLLQTASISFALFGLLFPLLLVTFKVKSNNNQYQARNILTLESIVNQQKGYLAGIELLYNQNQPVSELRHLDLRALEYLKTQSEQLKPTMLASLYTSPDISIHNALTRLKSHPVAFYVNNGRIQKLPAAIKSYLNQNYAHFAGSIYTYAPQIKEGSEKVYIPFSGYYLTSSEAHPHMDQHDLTAPQWLIKGWHHSTSGTPYKLLFLPAKKMAGAKIEKYDNWKKML